MKDRRVARFLMVFVLVLSLIGVASPIFAESTSSAAPGYAAPAQPMQSARQAPARGPLPQEVATATYIATYYRVMGGGFTPRNSSSTYYGGNGELIVTAAPSGDAIFHVPVHLPQGTIITGLMWYYYRPSTVTNGTVFFTVYNKQTSAIVQEWYQSCDVFTGYDWNYLYFNHTVDNNNYVYMLNYRPDSNSYNSNMQFMSMELWVNVPKNNQVAVVPLF
jgi:hypothetical protein